jgi:hypothetical protein
MKHANRIGLTAAALSLRGRRAEDKRTALIHS